MSAFEDIAKLLEAFGETLATDLRSTLKDQLKNVQASKIQIEPKVTVTPDSVTLQIQMDDYWKFIEGGRKKGAKQPPSAVFGKKWQNLHGMDARKILVEIKRKAGIKAEKKSLNYDKSVKTLSFLIARSIKTKGIKARPFIQPVISDGRMKDLQEALALLLQKNFEIIIKT